MREQSPRQLAGAPGRREAAAPVTSGNRDRPPPPMRGRMRSKGHRGTAQGTGAPVRRPHQGCAQGTGACDRWRERRQPSAGAERAAGAAQPPPGHPAAMQRPAMQCKPCLQCPGGGQRARVHPPPSARKAGTQEGMLLMFAANHVTQGIRRVADIPNLNHVHRGRHAPPVGNHTRGVARHSRHRQSPNKQQVRA